PPFCARRSGRTRKCLHRRLTVHNPIHLSIPVALALVAPARAQYDLSWFAIDCGGGASAGGSLTPTGPLAPPDAGSLSAGGFTLSGGFWSGLGSVACYANCDGSTTAPILNVADFACFLNRYAAADPYANCDGSTTAPILNVADFACFLNRYAAGCS